MVKFSRPLLFLFCWVVSVSALQAQLGAVKTQFTHQDSLRGSLNPERSWWNVLQYHIYVEPDYAKKSIAGWNEIRFEALQDGKNKTLQLDLQEPMELDSVKMGNQSLSYKREGNVFHLQFGSADFVSGKTAVSKKIKVPDYTIRCYFHGKVREAVRPPWDGGWIWARDAKNRPWISAACQGLGASVWYPCKDYQGDEPDQGAVLDICVADTLTAVGNGRLISNTSAGHHKTVYSWEVKNPINNYDIIPYIGNYTHMHDTLQGINGKILDLDYWVLDYNQAKAKKQFDRDVKRMLRAFEYWFGPYPFYEDSYKLVESPHLGMEHQSATAYGNQYMNGYLGMDLSGSGWGLKWDYIVIHESGHEWFGNNITTNDLADMWVHEGFTMYSEALFIEYYYGKKAADEYVLGIRSNIDNDRPLIGPYGVNKEGSGDMYNKGANLLHTIRQVLRNDSLFRSILIGLNKDFYHQTVNSRDVELYFSKKSGIDLSKVFDQYLRTTEIPQLEYTIHDNILSYRWTNCIKGFNMPVKLNDSAGTWLQPGTSWKNMPCKTEYRGNGFKTDSRFYVTVKKSS